MKALRRLLLILSLAWAGTTSLNAQFPEGRYRNLEALVESLAETVDDNEASLSWLEELHELHENQVNINSCSRDDLLKIPFVNEITAEKIMNYRTRNGPFYSVYEIAAVEGIGSDMAEKLSFFIYTGDTPSHSEPSATNTVRHEWLVRGNRNFPVSSGYKATGDEPRAYPGSAERFYFRYICQNTDRWQAGLTAEKDPGEPFFRAGNPYGFDFYSGHLSFVSKNRKTKLIAGDFTARSGQGLVIWQGFQAGKSSDVTQVSRNTSQIRPYTSTDENLFFRGIASSVEIRNSRINLFFSSKRSDANLEVSDSLRFITSLQTSGYHRTRSESEDEKSVRHSVAGMIWNFHGRNFKAGLTLLYEKLGYPYRPGEQLYEKFYFNGRENFNIGSDYRWVRGGIQAYGEAAVSRSGGLGFLQGLDARLHDQVHVALHFRHFDKDYHGTWASVFADDSKAINETGVYSGLRVLPAPGIILSGYTDWHSSHWIKYTTASPSSGNDFYFQADFRFLPNFSGYFRFRERNRDVKIHDENLYLVKKEERQNFRAHFRTDPSETIRLQSRIEAVRVISGQWEKGFLVYQDLAWSPVRIPVSAVFRAAWFHTDSYSSRIFAYENDLLYTFSSLSFYGKGIRTYFDLHIRLTNKLEGWLKAANTSWFGQETAGTGNDKIYGSSKSEIKIQIRYRL
jgi:hypothetical protein